MSAFSWRQTIRSLKEVYYADQRPPAQVASAPFFVFPSAPPHDVRLGRDLPRALYRAAYSLRAKHFTNTKSIDKHHNPNIHNRMALGR